MGCGSSSSSNYNRQAYHPQPVNMNALAPPQAPWGWHRFGGKYCGRPTVVHCQIGSFVFLRGEDHVVYAAWCRTGGTWTEWHSLGRTAQGDIAAVFCPPDQVHVFIRDRDDCVYHRWYERNGWEPPTREWFPRHIQASGDIAAVCVGTEIHLLVPGTDYIWHSSMSPGYTGWCEWESLPASIQSRLQVVTPYVGRLDLFVCGNNEHIYQQVLDGAGWREEWTEVGGPVVGEIVPVCVGQGYIYIFALNKDSVICYTSLGESDWSEWVPLPGMYSIWTPAITASPEGFIDLYTVFEEVGGGGGYIIYSSSLTNLGWSDWQRNIHNAEHTPDPQEENLGLTVDSHGMVYAMGWGNDLWRFGPA